MAHDGRVEATDLSPVESGDLDRAPDRAAFDAVALVRFRREHGRWPTVDEAIAVTGSVLIGRTGLEGSIVMPEDPTRAWAEWTNAEAERRHAELLARIAESHRRSEEQRDEFIAQLQALARELGVHAEQRR
jgi:hypothetical protein